MKLIRSRFIKATPSSLTNGSLKSTAGQANQERCQRLATAADTGCTFRFRKSSDCSLPRLYTKTMSRYGRDGRYGWLRIRLQRDRGDGAGPPRAALEQPWRQQNSGSEWSSGTGLPNSPQLGV
jgi:hypothetical protein